MKNWILCAIALAILFLFRNWWFALLLIGTVLLADFELGRNL